MAVENDHDVLIELRTMVRLWHEESTRTLQEHAKSDTKEFTELNMKVDAAHNRMDKLKKEMAESLESVSTKLGKIGSLKDKVLGGGILGMFLITTALSIISVMKGH